MLVDWGYLWAYRLVAVLVGDLVARSGHNEDSS